jgi:glycosyltransferase involved in cell wall biosynthesis
MAEQKNSKRITAIVPAYNEAPRIGKVLEVLTTYPSFKEIIVVDDGSSDHTEDVVKNFNVRYIKNPVNNGKGYAMDRAVSLANGDVVFFCDADISGLTHGIIDEITHPVLAGEVDMFIGMRNRRWYVAHQMITFIPLLGGERALTKNLWQKLPSYYKQYFRIEAALNFYALYYGRGFQYKVFKGLSQVIKEKKYGFWDGMRQRWNMMYHIFSAQLKLHDVHIPESARNRRLLGMIALQSVAGMVLGALFFAAIYVGPTDFVRSIFAEELREDPTAPFANFLLSFTDITTVGTIAIIGFLIFLPNAMTFLFTFPKLSYLLYGWIYKIKSNKS